MKAADRGDRNRLILSDCGVCLHPEAKGGKVVIISEEQVNSQKTLPAERSHTRDGPERQTESVLCPWRAEVQPRRQ